MRAIITGAATGIGALTVRKLKARGFEVVALDIAEPVDVDQWIRVDMADTQSIDTALKRLLGGFDCLINNAGLPPRPGLEREGFISQFFWSRPDHQRPHPLSS